MASDLADLRGAEAGEDVPPEVDLLAVDGAGVDPLGLSVRQELLGVLVHQDVRVAGRWPARLPVLSLLPHLPLEVLPVGLQVEVLAAADAELVPPVGPPHAPMPTN